MLQGLPAHKEVGHQAGREILHVRLNQQLHKDIPEEEKFSSNVYVHGKLNGGGIGWGLLAQPWLQIDLS